MEGVFFCVCVSMLCGGGTWKLQHLKEQIPFQGSFQSNDVARALISKSKINRISTFYDISYVDQVTLAFSVLFILNVLLTLQ